MVFRNPETAKLVGAGSPKIGNIDDLGNIACVQLLEAVLADAKLGKVTSVAVVSVGPSDFGSAHAGPDAAKLNLGIDVLKREILERISPTAPQSKIIRR